VGDIPGMQALTNNSKYAILNDQGELIRGKVNRSFFFYSRSGYAKEHYADWIPILREAQAYAQKQVRTSSETSLLIRLKAGSSSPN
jgi:hypothetical protein